VPVRKGQCPRSYGAERPRALAAVRQGRDALGELPQRPPGRGAAAGLDVGGQAQDRFSGGVRAVDDEPRRRAPAVDRLPGAVPVQDLSIEGGDGQVEPLPQEVRERRIGAPPGGVALAERPHHAGQPVRRAAVGRIGQLRRLGARVEGAVRLHPEDHVAGVRPGRRLQVGQAAQQRIRRGPAARGAGLPPVPQVHHRRARDVVGVEGTLAVGVVGRIVGPAADPPVRSVRIRLGIGPQHADAGRLGEPVGGVTRNRGHGDGVTQEVQVGEVGELCRSGLDRC